MATIIIGVFLVVFVLCLFKKASRPLAVAALVVGLVGLAFPPAELIALLLLLAALYTFFTKSVSVAVEH